MKKVYLMKGMAALTLGLVVASCNKMNFDGNNTVTPEQAKANAEAQLGVTIDPNQDWNMTGEVEASVVVNGFQGASYTVTIYDANPLTGEAVTAYGSKTVQSGQTANFKFIAPKGLSTVFAAIKDAKGYTYAKPAFISNGKLEAAFGNTSAANAPSNRALTLNAADDFVIPVYEQPAVSQYLEGAAEINTHNAANDFPLTDLTAEEQAQVPESDKIQMSGWIKVSQKKLKMTHDWSAAITALGLTDAAADNMNARSLYIENATWYVPENTSLQVGQGTEIIVGANGKIVIPASATIKFTGNADYNCQLIVLATGKIEGAGTLEFSNGSLSGKYDYNAGTIDVGTLNNNGGEFYNVGVVKAKVLKGGAGKSTYINRGKVTITSSDYGSGSANTRILNNCWWEVEQNLFARNIVQGEGAYIHVGTNFEMSCGNDGTTDAAYIYAKKNSLIEVEGAASFNNVDVVGPTNDWAYLQFGYIEDAWSTHQLHCATNYTGWPDITCGAIINNIRLSVDNYQDYGACRKVVHEMLNGTAGCGKQVGNGNAEYVAKGQVDELVTEDECSPGIQIVPPTPIIENGPVYSYAFEDTWQGDYDMNDVVLKVRQEKETTNDVVTSDKIIVKLVASGATLDLNIRLYDYSATGEKGYGESFTVLSKNGYDEVHDLFGVDKKTMVNTGNGATAAAVTFELNNSDGKYNNADGVFDPAKLRFAIYSAEQGEVRLAGNGESPFGIIIPENWKWPIERVNITNAYKKLDADAEGEGNEDQSFASFAETVGSALNWFKYPTGQVYTTTVQEDF